MKKRCIERDKKGNLVSWYGFHVDENVDTKACYLDFFAADEPCTATLYLHSNPICQISYYKFWVENFANKKVVHSENEIAEFIYQECLKYLGCEMEIYVDDFSAENLALAGDYEDFMTEAEADIEDFFFQKEVQEAN